MARQYGVRSLRLIFAVFTFYAILTQLRIHIGLGFNVINFFSYFTNLSNLFAASVLLAGALLPERVTSSVGFSTLRLLATVSMLIVGIVFALLLRNVDLGSLLPWINMLLHYVMPIVVLADWIADPPNIRFRLLQLWPVIALPALYLLYVLLRGSAIGWYPYPFLNPAIAGGAGMVAAYALGIAVAVCGAGWSVLRVARARNTRPRST